MSARSSLHFLNPILNEIEPETLSDATLSKLRCICPEKLILAALDIIDRGNVVHYVTPWGHDEYQVLGSSGSYSVLLDLTISRATPFTCTCPAFIYSVLLSQTHLLCKHTLATLIARRLNQCIERPANVTDLEDLYRQQFPSEQEAREMNAMESEHPPSTTLAGTTQQVM